MLIVRLIKIFAALTVLYFLFITFNYFQVHRAEFPPGWDFSQHYAAAVLAMQGRAAEAYNFQQLSAMESVITGCRIQLAPFYLLWNYPPTFLLVVMPLALLPYKAALILWLGIFFLAYVWMLHRIAPHPLTFWLALAFPANYWNFLHCQNGFFFATVLGAGLLLWQRRPRLSGVLLGLVTCKPHLAWIIPLALLFGRRWKALGAMVITVAAMVAGSIILFGFETWKAFVGNAPFIREILESGAARGYKSASVFAGARMLGASVPTAYVLQILSAIMAIGVVGYAWRRWRDPVVLNPLLVLGILLSTPYLMVHDLAILAIPIAYFVWQNYDKNLKSYEIITLALAWALPLYSQSLALLARIQIAPFIFLAFMAIIVLRACHCRVNKDGAPASGEASGQPGSMGAA